MTSTPNPQHKCTKCQEVLTIDNFTKRGGSREGYQSGCKVCRKIEAREWRLNNKDKIKEKDKRYRFKNPDKIRKSLKDYALRNKEKLQARELVNNAVLKGTLKKEFCTVCGATRVQGHHEDYSKPLEVIWLCCFHHNQRHIELREERNE